MHVLSDVLADPTHALGMVQYLVTNCPSGNRRQWSSLALTKRAVS